MPKSVKATIARIRVRVRAVTYVGISSRIDAADDQRSPEHRLARAEALQQLLADPDERHDGDGVPERQQPGPLRAHAAADLHQGHGHDDDARDGVEQQVRERCAGIGRVPEQPKSTKAFALPDSTRKKRTPNTSSPPAADQRRRARPAERRPWVAKICRAIMATHEGQDAHDVELCSRLWLRPGSRGCRAPSAYRPPTPPRTRRRSSASRRSPPSGPRTARRSPSRPTTRWTTS